MPVRNVDKMRFQKLMKVFDSGYKVPAQKHFCKNSAASAVSRMQGRIQGKVDKQLHKLPGLLTCGLPTQQSLT